MSDNAACSHSHVHLDPIQSGGGFHDAWKCVHCKIQFYPHYTVDQIIEIGKAEKSVLWEKIKDTQGASSVRDQFAMAALPEVCRESAAVTVEQTQKEMAHRGVATLMEMCAQQAYEMADAMMKAREGK